MKWFRSKISKDNKDKGDAVLVTMIIAIPLFFLCMGFATDITNNIVQGQAYASMASQSSETAIKSIKGNGSLWQGVNAKKQPAGSVTAFVNEYLRQRDGVASGAEVAGASSLETKAMRGHCTTAEVNGITRTLPYIEVNLDTQRTAGISTNASTAFTSEGGGPIKNGVYSENKIYRVLTATVYEANKNMILGVVDMPCQVHKSVVSAVSFGSKEDLVDQIVPTTGPSTPTVPVPTSPGTTPLPTTPPTTAPTTPAVKGPVLNNISRNICVGTTPLQIFSILDVPESGNWRINVSDVPPELKVTLQEWTGAPTSSNGQKVLVNIPKDYDGYKTFKYTVYDLDNPARTSTATMSFISITENCIYG